MSNQIHRRGVRYTQGHWNSKLARGLAECNQSILIDRRVLEVDENKVEPLFRKRGFQRLRGIVDRGVCHTDLAAIRDPLF